MKVTIKPYQNRNDWYIANAITPTGKILVGFGTTFYKALLNLS